MRVPSSAVLLAVTLLGTPHTAWSQAKRPITERDLFQFTWVADPQLSPDGSRVAFTRVVVDDKRTEYETSIWIVASTGNEAPVRMTNGKHDARPRWSADGRRIAFVRGEKDEDGSHEKTPWQC